MLFLLQLSENGLARVALRGGLVELWLLVQGAAIEHFIHLQNNKTLLNLSLISKVWTCQSFFKCW